MDLEKKYLQKGNGGSVQISSPSETLRTAQDSNRQNTPTAQGSHTVRNTEMRHLTGVTARARKLKALAACSGHAPTQFCSCPWRSCCSKYWRVNEATAPTRNTYCVVPKISSSHFSVPWEPKVQSRFSSMGCSFQSRAPCLTTEIPDFCWMPRF